MRVMMAAIPGFSLIDISLYFVLMISAVLAAMQNMQRDETKFTSFDVKPGAGSQQFNQELVIAIIIRIICALYCFNSVTYSCTACAVPRHPSTALLFVNSGGCPVLLRELRRSEIIVGHRFRKPPETDN